MSLKHLFGELKRRHVMRVMGLYLVGAWIVIQVAATVFPLFGWPEAAATAVVIIAALGLPIVVLLAWVFDITPQGIQRTSELDASGHPVEGAVSDVQLQLEAHQRRFAARAMGFVGVGILVALVGFAAFGHYGDRVGRGSVSSVESIAVLPFEDQSPNHDQEYFTDGIAEEILNQLAQVEGLRVAGRTSSFAFKGQKVESAQIGQRLRVQAILEGSVRRENDNVRVTARLVNTENATVIWTGRYDMKISSMLAIQDTISNAIVDALKLKLSNTPELADGGTSNTHAHDLYLKGLEAFNERTDAQLQVALEYFQKAAEADTGYALAHAGLAKTYAVLPTVGNFSVIEAVRKGTESAARALALNPSLGEAYAALGQLAQNLEWDLTSALRNYNRAVKFSPNDAVAHQWYSEALMMTGDLAAASTQIERALEIDPLSPAARSVRAYQMMLRGDLPEAVRAYQNLLRESPNLRVGQLNYAFAALAARDYSAAAEGLIGALPRYAPNVGVLIGAASGQADKQEAISAIKALEGKEPASIVALLYAAVGAKAQALAVLEKAFRASEDANFPYILVHPLLTPLHSDPKFQNIVRTVGVRLPT